METKEIKFYEDVLLGVKDEDEQVWLGVKQVCLNIGLSEGQSQRQLTNLQSDLIFKKSVKNLNCKFATQVRKITCIKEDFVTLWLAKIRLTPTMQRDNPKTVEKLIKYQLEAQKVLHNYFMGTEEKKQDFYDEMGLQGQIVEMQTCIENQTIEIKDLKENVKTLIDNSTINMKQQKELYNLAKERICSLLGGKKTQEYKLYSKLYFQNLWGDIKRNFDCSGSYHDLNPKDYKKALDYIKNWNYIA